jgi:hypothetical protein
MKKIDFETSEPLFSLKEVNDLMSVTASILVEACKKRSTSFKEWSDYIDRWCQANYMPEEIKSHLYEVIIPSLNSLKRHE